MDRVQIEAGGGSQDLRGIVGKSDLSPIIAIKW